MQAYLDSCMVIYLIEGIPHLRDWVSARLLAPKDAPRVAFSDLSRLECRIKPLASNDSRVLADYDDFFATPGYIRLPINTAVFDIATELRARHRLPTPDALHLAAALAGGCEQFWTNDRRLEQAAAGRLTVVFPHA
jgi:uncharacterized protein